MTDLFAEPAPLPPAGERILAAASSMFYESGIHAVGVDAIAEAAGTTKKTLYDRFGSKDALIAAYLVRRGRRWQAYLAEVADRRRPGISRVLAVFDALASWTRTERRGCGFVNAYAEYGGRDDAIEAVVRAEKQWMRAWFVEGLRDAGMPAARAARLGAAVHLLYEGAIVTLTAGGDADAVATARRAARDLLAA
ncbi:transcriptional regulator, TetR family [Jatrophihabitans endophyticus]|uniref:Transcriptional regulator, TetR family n=1 Tax=Jatrophihabitans endophyticus TaxID=1206085 RepID=A0A1M5IU72_9ACTN|nr:TetR/AcrR family transcriptional regulator [Jatrophihabitans endophyticus]SHG31892.1 transcriptional regulator, TetR family [Jatrophihabitans endophyticus]